MEILSRKMIKCSGPAKPVVGLPELSFYNFPYTLDTCRAEHLCTQKRIGRAIYAQIHRNSRDTGRMTAEDLIMKHLNEDIRRPEFWQKSIDVVKEKIRRYPVPNSEAALP